MNHLMDYGPDWPPAPEAVSGAMSAYGYDSRRRRKARQAADRRRFVFWLRTLLIAALLCLAAFAVVDSRIEPGRGEPMLHFVDAPDVTTTLPPHPAR